VWFHEIPDGACAQNKKKEGDLQETFVAKVVLIIVPALDNSDEAKGTREKEEDSATSS